MAIQEKFTVTSRVDTLKLSGLYMQPDQKPCKGIVQILHGMSEHKERYIPFMEFLADCGYASIIHDHRGHGESVYNSKLTRLSFLEKSPPNIPRTCGNVTCDSSTNNK